MTKYEDEMARYSNGYTPYEHGYNTYLEGGTISQNPYEKDTAEYYAWSWGFEDATQEN
jgi:hypothetical protein